MTNIKPSLAIMQPYFFPYIGYFQLINAVDRFVVYDDVNFIKQGWIARNRILLDGREHMLSLQLEGASSFKRINEVGVGRNSDKLLKTLSQAYRKSPFFDRAYPVLEKILTNEDDRLGTYLFTLIETICHYLRIETELILSSSIPKDNTLRGQDKVLHICEVLGATTYINSSGGKDLYSKDVFSEHGIDLQFLNPSPITYRQFSNEFLPWLSIIDIMMFNSVEAIQEHLGRYELS